MRLRTTAAVISALLGCGSCGAIEELRKPYVVSVRHPVPLESLTTNYQGRCKGVDFLLSVRDIGRAGPQNGDVSISFGGRRRELAADAPLVGLLTQDQGATRVLLTCSPGLGSVIMNLTSALGNGAYVDAIATIDRRLNMEIVEPETMSREEYERLFNFRRQAD